MTPADRAWELLADGLTPQAIIRRLTPATKPEAIHAARRLPLLAERPVGDRGAAMARIAARIGMKRFGLSFAPDGRVVDRRDYDAPVVNPDTRELAGEGCTVTYTARYGAGRDHFQFLGAPSGEPDEWGIIPRESIPLSGTGHWSHFAPTDAVAALGGPEAYLAAYVAAGPERDRLFREAFEGERLEVVKKPRKPVVGRHTERMVEPPVAPEKEPEEPPGGQRSLFS